MNSTNIKKLTSIRNIRE